MSSGGVLGRRCAVSLSSWFCLPEQGMKDFEILCRSSAFLVPAKPQWGKSNYHVITVAHGLVPWRYKSLFPDEWLQAVGEKHTVYSAEMRYANGEFTTLQLLQPRVFLHPSKDLAALHLEDEEKALDLFQKLGLDTGLRLMQSSASMHSEQALEFHGYEVTGSTAADGADQRQMSPRVVSGSLLQKDTAKSNSVLCAGMSGGPVFLPPLPQVVYGMTTNADKNHVSFIDGQEIMKFIEDIEAGKVESFEAGAEATEHVGKDQDPEKMDFKKFL